MENICTSTKQLNVVLDNKFENSDWNKVTKNQYHHLTEEEQKYLLNLLQNFEAFWWGAPGTWNIYLVYFELK